MDPALIFIFIAVALIIITLQVLVYLKKETLDPNADKSIMQMQSRFEHEFHKLSNQMEQRFSSSNNELHGVLRERDSEVRKLFSDITREVTEVKETNKNVFSMTTQLQNLEKVLTHQKQRGTHGEASLELILGSILPPGVYALQYRFLSGEIVDAIIQTKDGIIPVDAKFSLDNYNRLVQENDPAKRDILEADFRRDLKLRIDETSKYIKEEEGTLPFAFMFIPAEGIYYDLLINEIGNAKNRANNRSLIDYAYKDKRVIIVSPTTFYAYLQSVLYGFRAFKIEESAKQIEGRVHELQKHINAYDEYMKKLGNTLGTSVNHYNAAYKEFKKIDKDVARVTGNKSLIDPVVLEKPDSSD